MRNQFKNLLILERIGSSYVLFVVDVILFLLIVINIFQINSFVGTSLFKFRSLVDSIENISAKGIIFSSLYLLVTPIAIAFASFLFPDIHSHRTTSYTIRNWFFKFHVFVSLMLCLIVSNLDNFNSIAGYSLDVDGKGNVVLKDNYKSWIAEIALALPGILTFIFYIYKLIHDRFNDHNAEHTPSLTRSWSTFMGLGDVASDYMPNQDIRKWVTYFNNASMSPDINWILKKSTKYRSEYQKIIPTSEEAQSYLMGVADECREILLDHLVADKYSVRYNVEFYAGTSRAFEVILVKSKNIKHIIVSPFEHESQIDVIRWHKKNMNDLIELSAIPFDEKYLDFTLQRPNNEELVIEDISKLICSIENTTSIENIAILLSELNYKSGYHVDVSSVIKRVRESYPGVVFIIDGSQSVGNIKNPLHPFCELLTTRDFYYFSTHKWLLSPNTCGVVVTPQPFDFRNRSYDVFDFKIPTSTIDPNTIFGLRASLEFIFKEISFQQLRMKSKLLRECFEYSIPKGFDFIGNIKRTESSFISIRPKANYKWIPKTREDILGHFKSRSLDTTVIEIKKPNGSEFWIRLSFPYFIEQFQINRLNKILAECIHVRN